MATKINFTKRSIEALPVPKDKRAIVYDIKVTGLGCMTQPSGHKSFFWFRKVCARPTWKTIGAVKEVTVEQARDQAAAWSNAVVQWKNKNYAGPSPFARVDDLTLDAAASNYIEMRLKSRGKHNAAKDTRRMIDRYCQSLKSRPIDSIRRQDVRSLHADVGEKHGQVQANRVLQTIRAIFNFAIRSEVWSGDNPATRIDRFPETERERFLQPGEAPAFFKALSDEPNADLRDLVVLAVFIGTRKSNLISMRWDHIDLTHATWSIPGTETKNCEPHVAPLVDEALKILKDRHRQRKSESPWVFPSKVDPSINWRDPKRAWDRFRKRAGLADVRFHDLRRTLGSWQAGAGVSLPVIAESLGHADATTTAKIYARLNLAPVRAAVNLATGAMIAAAKLPKATRRKLLGPPR